MGIAEFPVTEKAVSQAESCDETSPRPAGLIRVKLCSMDERPAIEQVKSGFKIAGAILSSFAAFLLFGVGYIDITRPEHQEPAVGSLILVTLVVAMFLTVRFWVKWFCGIVSYLAVRSTFLVFFAGRGRFSELSFWSAVAFSASLWFMAILSIHFYKRSHFSILDQLSITTAASCLFWGFLRLDAVGDNGMLLPFAIGIPLMMFSAYEKTLKRFGHKLSA